MKFSPERRRSCAVFLCICAVMPVYWLLAGKVQICVFRLFTGLPCPGCGLTHAALALLRGDWRASFAYHPLLLPALGVFAVVLFRKHHPFAALAQSRWFFLLIFFLFMALYAARMIAFFPDGPYPMVYDRASLAGMLCKLLAT